MYRRVYIVLCNTYMHAMQLHSIVRINNWIELNKRIFTEYIQIQNSLFSTHRPPYVVQHLAISIQYWNTNDGRSRDNDQHVTSEVR